METEAGKSLVPKKEEKKENREKKIIAIQDLIKLLNILPVRSCYPLKEILSWIFPAIHISSPLKSPGTAFELYREHRAQRCPVFFYSVHQGGLGTKIPERMIFCLQLLLQMFLWNSLVAVWSSVLFENILGLFSIKGKAGREHSKWKDISSWVLSEIYFSVNKVPLGINCSSFEMYYYSSYHICQFRKRDNLLSILFPWKLILLWITSTTLSFYPLDQI